MILARKKLIYGAVAIIAMVLTAMVYLNNKADATEYIHLSYAVNIENDNELVGIADNVFLGRVMKQSGNKQRTENAPEKQYDVEVVKNIKGVLPSAITVNQLGGYNQQSLVLVEGDRLLVEGGEYLFITKHNSEENWHTLVNVKGNLVVDSEKTRMELTERFEKAFSEQIPFDIRSKNREKYGME